MSRLSITPWLADATTDWMVIALAMCVVVYWTSNPLAIILAVLVIGNRQHALAILGHDGGHRLICHARWLNDFLTCTLSFWPLMVGLDGYRVFHFAHHRWLGTDKDPELTDLEGWSEWEYRCPPSKPKIIALAMADLCGYGVAFILKAAILIGKKSWLDYLGPVLWWLVVGGALVYEGLWQVPVLWFASLFTSFAACFRLRVWTEHRCAHGGTHRFTPSWISKALYLPHNTWLHYEHHAAASVPYWQLPQVRYGSRMA